VSSARFVPDGRHLLFSSHQLIKAMANVDGAVQWVDVATGKRIREHVVAGRAWSATPSPDLSLIALYVEKDIDEEGKPGLVVLDAETGKERLRIEITARPEALHWSGDGRQLLCCSAFGLIVIDVATGKLVSRFELPHEYPQRPGQIRRPGPTAAAFMQRSPTVVTCGWSEVYGWSTLTGQKRWTIKAEGPHFRGLAISPDEAIVAVIASAGDANMKTLRLYDIATERELAHFELGRENCDRLAFSPDGGRILIGFYDGTALVYDVVAAVARAGF
jgi:WD40 repeat protein